MKPDQNMMQPNPELLLDLVNMQMPFGKYKGALLCNIPVSYLEWFNQKGFPQGKLGILLQTMYEIKLNGLEDLLKPLKNKNNFLWKLPPLANWKRNWTL